MMTMMIKSIMQDSSSSDLHVRVCGARLSCPGPAQVLHRPCSRLLLRDKCAAGQGPLRPANEL